MSGDFFHKFSRGAPKYNEENGQGGIRTPSIPLREIPVFRMGLMLTKPDPCSETSAERTIISVVRAQIIRRSYGC